MYRGNFSCAIKNRSVSQGKAIPFVVIKIGLGNFISFWYALRGQKLSLQIVYKIVYFQVPYKREYSGSFLDTVWRSKYYEYALDDWR